MPPSPTPRSTSSSKSKVWATRSGCQPTGSCRKRLDTCSSVPSVDRRIVRRYYASFSYQAQSWKKPRRMVAKVEWHPGELYVRVGFIVTNLVRPAERVVAFYNQRGTADSGSKKGR